jgi:DNA-directed RNA polymerase sigma subunit (sigma70/sigma32)
LADVISDDRAADRGAAHGCKIQGEDAANFDDAHAARRKIICMRFIGKRNYTPKKPARCSVSRAKIRQVEAIALKKLRRSIRPAAPR